MKSMGMISYLLTGKKIGNHNWIDGSYIYLSKDDCGWSLARETFSGNQQEWLDGIDFDPDWFFMDGWYVVEEEKKVPGVKSCSQCDCNPCKCGNEHYALEEKKIEKLNYRWGTTVDFNFKEQMLKEAIVELECKFNEIIDHINGGKNEE